MPFSLSQRKALAWAPRVSGVLSMIGSALIVKAVVCRRGKPRRTYHNILFAMSLIDLFSSLSYAFSTLPVPKGTPGIWGASGNQATCTIQAFFIQTSTWIPVLNASLAIYYVLVCRFNWSEERIQKLQSVMIGIPTLMAYGTATACVPLKLYNNANLWCWIAPYPLDCRGSYRYGEEADCVRGDNAWIYRWAFTYAPAWTSIVAATVSMLMVYCQVLNQEKAVDKFQEDGVLLRKQSKRVAWQSFWYVVSFYITWIPGTIVRVLQSIPSTKGKVYFPMIFAMSLCLPMQGWFNFIVFSRSRYQKYKRINPSCSRFEAIQYAAFSLNVMRCSMQQDLAPDTNMTSPALVPTDAILQSEVGSSSFEKKQSSVTD